MDEFEIFKARASGCEIQIEDLDSSEIFHRASPRESLRSEGYQDDARRSSRRKSLRKNSRRLPEKENDGSLQVKVEIQPPSPVACRRLSEQRRDSDEQSLNSFKFNYNGIHSGDAESNFAEDAFKSSPHVDARRRSRHSFTGSCHGDDVLPSGEFSRDSSDKDEDQKFQRSKSCRNTSFNDKRRISNLIQEHSTRRPSQIQNSDSNVCQDSEPDSMGSNPTVYRVRSFTTKKGEIISRGDSFKVCGSGNRQFLLVGGDQRSACQRRCSAAVAGGSYSRLEVCSLAPGNNSMRRNSLTCLTVNESMMSSQLAPIARRGSSECRRVSSSKIDVLSNERRKSSLTSARESFPQELVGQQEAIEQWSNKSNDAEHVQCCMTEELHAPPPQVYHVTVFGSSGVGKSTLVNQLMTSEYLANKEQTDQGDDEMERLVSVVLDGMESTVHFHDGLCTDEDVQTDAYLLVFSVTERNSLTFTQSCLHDILRHDKRFHHQISFQRKVPLRLRFHRQKASAGGTPVVSEINFSHDKHRQLDEEDVEPPKPVLYLVGNKQDLVRNRVVSEADVKKLMEVKKNRCKYAEVSALLDHKVDEVLVDIVREIRARASRAEQEDSDIEDVSGRGCLQQAMVGFCGKLFK